LDRLGNQPQDLFTKYTVLSSSTIATKVPDHESMVGITVL
jgi:hypothetical protein